MIGLDQRPRMLLEGDAMKKPKVGEGEMVSRMFPKQISRRAYIRHMMQEQFTRGTRKKHHITGSEVEKYHKR